MAKRKRSTFAMRYRNRITLTGLVSAVIVLSVLITANGSWQLPFLPTWDSIYSEFGLRSAAPPEGQMRVTVMDVGNADCILLQSGGQTALIDAGENDDEETILAVLKNASVDRLDYVIATHADADHIGSMDAVIRNFEIGTFIMSFMPEGHTPTTRTYEQMLDAMLDCNVVPIEAEYGATYTFGEATVKILSGLSEYTDTNDQSVVCLVSHGEMDFLFTGDAGKKVEREILEAIPTLDVEVLKVGHHGSRTSSDGTFIRRISPDIALITCGYNKSYQHPHAETIELLKRNSITIFRSDLNGKIILTSDGKSVSVKTEKDRGV